MLIYFNDHQIYSMFVSLVPLQLFSEETRLIKYEFQFLVHWVLTQDAKKNHMKLRTSDEKVLHLCHGCLV